MIDNQNLKEEMETIRASPRSEILKQVSTPAISFFLALIFGAFILIFLDLDPFQALEKMTVQSLTDQRIADTLFYATPLIFTGLSVAIAFRAGMFNIGTEGQMMMGAFVASLVGFGLKDFFGVDFPPIIFIPLLMIAGTIGGALWALIPALLKTRGVHEVISTIMMNYIAATLMTFLVGSSSSPFIDRDTINLSPNTPSIPESAELPLVFNRLFSRLTWGFFIGIAVCILIYVILWKTQLGFETRAVGNNPDAAKYSGINVNRKLITIMLISGGLGGLAGAVEVMGQFHMFIDGSLVGYGFDGIAVSIIGGNHPFGVFFGALLFGWLRNVSLIFQLPPYPIPKDVANTIKGFVVLLVAIPMISKIIFNRFDISYQGSWLNKEIDTFSSRYTQRKEELFEYFKIEDRNIVFKALIYALLVILILFWSTVLFISIWIIIGRTIWFFDLIDFILSNFWTPILGPEIGANLTNIDSFFILFLIFALILFVIIKFGKSILYFLRNSYTFFVEISFLSLKLSLLFLLHFFKVIYSFLIWGIMRLLWILHIKQLFQFIRTHMGEVVKIGVTLLFLGILLIYSAIAPEFDSFVRSLLVFSFLVLVFLIFLVNRRKLNIKGFDIILLIFGAWFGIIEFLTVTEFAGQEATLFGTITLVMAFILIQEYLANKEKIKVWRSNRELIKTTQENKLILKKYSFFSITLLFIFSLMVLIGSTDLPIQFFIPPIQIQNMLNLHVTFFNLRNYGTLLGIIGVIVLIYSYFYLRRITIPSQLNDIYNIPYYYISLSTVFIFFTLEIFFKFNSLVLFTALFGTLIVISSKLISYEWLIWKKGKHDQQKTTTGVENDYKTSKVVKIYSFICPIFVFITFVLSYFPVYIGSFVLPLVMLSLLFVLGLFVTVIEWLSWKRNPISALPAAQEEEKSDNSSSTFTRFYFYLLTLLVSLSISIFFIGEIHLPIQLYIFFFQLYNIGSLLGIVGIIIVIIGFLFAGKISTMNESGKNNVFPAIFKFLGVIFIFISLYTFFEMDPFLLIALTLIIATPIGFASLGGMFSEKSGVVNIGLEGMMLSGAFVAVMVTHLTGDPWAGVIGAIIAGLIMGFIHAVASIKYRADQVVVGVAINILASAMTTLGIWVIWGSPGQSDSVRSLPQVKLDFLVDIPIVGEFLYNLTNGSVGLSPLVYIFIATIPVTAWVIQRTTFGLRVRAVGEHPRAADTLGINVFKMRYICVMLSGVFAAVGGAQLTLGWISVFNKDMTGGRGFVALAALIFGSWNPIGAALASLFFGFAYSFRFQLEPQLSRMGIDWILLDLHIEDLTPTLPFVVTLIAVALVAKRMRAPAADGIPYVKEG